MMTFPITTDRRTQTETGFTLIELIVAVAIFSIISVGLMFLVGSIFSDSSKQGMSLANADQTRKLSNQLMQELRNSVPGSNGAYPIAVANAQELTFYSNIDGGSDIERVHYYVQNGTLKKGVLKQSGSPPTYTGAETVRIVQNDLANGADPIFTYYDSDYDSSSDSPLTQPVNISQITYIKANVKVYTKTGLSTSNNTYLVSMGTALRSLKTNLGN